MNKQIKALLIVVPICFALAGIAVLVCLFDWSFDIDYAYMVASAVFVVVRAFFIVPAVLFALDWLKERLEGMDERRAYLMSFRAGYLWGGLILMLMYVFSPVIGCMWFVGTVKGAVKNKKTKTNENSDELFKF